MTGATRWAITSSRSLATAQDVAMASQAVDAMVSSGVRGSDELASLLVNRAGRAYLEG
jgi:hypothetical protein